MGKSGTKAGVSPSISVFPLQLTFHECSILIVVFKLPLTEEAGEVWEPSHTAILFGILVGPGQAVTLHFLYMLQKVFGTC